MKDKLKKVTIISRRVVSLLLIVTLIISPAASGYKVISTEKPCQIQKTCCCCSETIESEPMTTSGCGCNMQKVEIPEESPMVVTSGSLSSELTPINSEISFIIDNSNHSYIVSSIDRIEIEVQSTPIFVLHAAFLI